jgi:formate dehydrogenase assembly factor FdhD
MYENDHALYKIVKYVTVLKTVSLKYFKHGISTIIAVSVLSQVTLQSIQDLGMLVQFSRTSKTNEEAYNRHM